MRVGFTTAELEDCLRSQGVEIETRDPSDLYYWHRDWRGNVADYCPLQPCPEHGTKFYGGRMPGPWEWETVEQYNERRAADFMDAIREGYATNGGQSAEVRKEGTT